MDSNSAIRIRETAHDLIAERGTSALVMRILPRQSVFGRPVFITTFPRKWISSLRR
jgi:hypothetical protein